MTVVAFHPGDPGVVTHIPTVAPRLLRQLMFPVGLPVGNRLQALPIADGDTQRLTGAFYTQETGRLSGELDHPLCRDGVTPSGVCL
jgi:hypothetical protein